jgi:hypothetical protein
MQGEEKGNGTQQNGESAALSAEQIKQLEATLSNFITNKKASGEFSGEAILSLARPRTTRAGHGSHVQE